MGDSLAVDEEDVGLEGEFLDGCDAGGGFPEREQAGDVGESDFPDGVGGFEEFELGHFQDDSGGDDLLFIFAESAIEARDEFGRFFQGGESDFGGECLLDFYGLGGREIPVVQVFNFHSFTPIWF